MKSNKLKLAKITYRDKIREIASNRGINCLFHFTPAPNLASILEHGLISRAQLSTAGLSAYTSIGQRLDGEDNAISVSISAINHRMFAAKRAASGRDDWIVLILCSSILWTHQCRYYPRNAARSDMRGLRGFLGGPWAFNRLFSNTPSPKGFTGESYRENTGIPEFLTTFSEAEIQVLEPIGAEYIRGAWASDLHLAKILQNGLDSMPDYDCKVISQDFSPRFENGLDAWG